MTGPERFLAPAPGRLLVATPVIEEPIFFRTVIGLLEHDNDVGTLGVVLNRPGHLLVSEVIPAWADAAGSPPVLFQGGPVAEGSALALAAVARPGDPPTNRDPATDPAPRLDPSSDDPAARDPASSAAGSGDDPGSGDAASRDAGAGVPAGPLSAAAMDVQGLTPLFDGLAVLDLDRDPALVVASLGVVRFYHGYAGWGPRQLQGEFRAGAWWVLPSLPTDWFSETPTQLWGQVLARLGGRWTMWANAPEDPSVN